MTTVAKMPTADPPSSKTKETVDVAPEKKAVDEAPDFIDMATFDQIREMDDAGNDDFSRAIVTGFLEQAQETFDKMDRSLESKDLEDLSSLGHFLKGSSATLGLVKIKDYCEQIQHYGVKKDKTGTKDMPEEEKCLSAIKSALASMRVEYGKAETYFNTVYPPEG